MNNITDDQLRALLAKMLPLAITQHACGKYYWIGSANGFVLDTELLHLTSLVEAGLTDAQSREYSGRLLILLGFNYEIPFFTEGGSATVEFEKMCGALRSATWQQRTTALAEVKGVAL